jgi:hypothetical protein
MEGPNNPMCQVAILPLFSRQIVLPYEELEGSTRGGGVNVRRGYRDIFRRLGLAKVICSGSTGIIGELE